MTTEDFLQDSFEISHFYDDKTDRMVCFDDDVKKAMIGFAKYHCEQMAQAIENEGISGVTEWLGNPYSGEGSEYVTKYLLFKAYPLENIK